MVILTDVVLLHAEEYTAFVIAVDESGSCDLAVSSFLVDTTPPTEGEIKLTNSVDMVYES